MAERWQALGKVLSFLRKERGLTQEKLGESCDLHPVHISAIERGKKKPSIQTSSKNDFQPLFFWTI